MPTIVKRMRRVDRKRKKKSQLILTGRLSVRERKKNTNFSSKKQLGDGSIICKLTHTEDNPLRG